MRLGIYASAYRLRHIEALEGDFGAFRAYTGPERLRKSHAGISKLILRNISHCAITAGSLAQFLADTAPYKNEPLLAESGELRLGANGFLRRRRQPGGDDR